MPSTPAATTLYIARHGQSATNHQALVTGQLDVPLSDTGHAQGRALAACLAGVPLAAIYTSALLRTRDTAAPTAAALGLQPVPLAALDEIHMGELQGRHRDERDPAAQALWADWQADPWGRTVPGGESYTAFAARVTQALHGLLQRHAGHSILVVGHRATNRVLVGTLLGWPRERWADFGPRHRFCYRVQVCAETGTSPLIDTMSITGSKAGSWQPGLVS